MNLSGVILKRRKDKHKQFFFPARLMCIIFCFVVAFSAAIKKGSEPATDIKDISTAISVTAHVTPTRWWIKPTGTAITPLPPATNITPSELLHNSCFFHRHTPLKPNTYGYVSPGLLPNRVRSTPSLSSDYLGKIEPGEGVKITEGSACVDGYSWRLIESVNGRLRGWTVEGTENQQWILPCPKENSACSEKAAPEPTKAPTPSQENESNACQSEGLSAGMVVQVKQDSILVLRSEPDAGDIIGRVGPTTTVKILDGPACFGYIVWWKLDTSEIIGWAAGNNLQP